MSPSLTPAVEGRYLLSDTLIASTPPLWFVRDSYETFALDGSVVMSPGMLLLCTKRFPPSLGTIQPYPLSASKVLTIPFFKKKNTSLNLMNEGQRGAGTQTRFQRSVGRASVNEFTQEVSSKTSAGSKRALTMRARTS